ncbi:MAG: hypothetical protein NTZ72_13280 [Afipia sp.]|nr:hypothetical protein [Afipia sp.]
MKVFFEILTFGSSGIAAILWFKSASTRLTTIGPGLEELDLVNKLSSDLQRAAKWNFWAALTTGVSVVTQIAARAL